MDDTGLSEKISAAFSARLKRAHPNSRWRALVVLRRAGDLNERSRDRSEQVRRVKESAKAALNEIDTILAAHHGRRLEDEPNALGYVAVEATPAGIRALTESNHVRAIIEDQAVRSVR